MRSPHACTRGKIKHTEKDQVVVMIAVARGKSTISHRAPVILKIIIMIIIIVTLFYSRFSARTQQLAHVMSRNVIAILSTNDYDAYIILYYITANNVAVVGRSDK